MKNLIFTFLMVILLPFILQAQWTERSAGLPSGNFPNIVIDAIDQNNAIVSYSAPPYYMYRTINGGESWQPLSCPNRTICLSVADKNRIWLATTSGEIYYTSDGGGIWTLQFKDLAKTNFMNYIRMFDNNEGIAMGDAPNSTTPSLVVKTLNGGQTWEVKTNSALMGGYSNNTWHQIDFPDRNTGYFYKSYSGAPAVKPLYKTTDAGLTWTTTGLSESIQFIKFYNSIIGIALKTSPAPVIFRTYNGGLNWESYSVPLMSYGDMEFIKGDASRMWASDGNLFFSSDTGRTWTKYNPEITLVSDIVITADNTAWAAASNGKIYRMLNSDNVTSIKPELNKEITFSLSQNYPNPFNPTTQITYSIKEPGLVTLKIYDILGTEIKTVVKEYQNAGKYTIDFNGSALSSGTYLYELKSGAFREVKKMILAK